MPSSRRACSICSRSLVFTLSALVASIWMPEVAGRDLTDPRDAI
ncbi:hypothetical protein [Microbacterium sp. AK031]|nr:hypothetical protein [Microbacterium sp. AK031]MCS3844415.1 hypothetical protein [Microbacterium sp. AK031]